MVESMDVQAIARAARASFGVMAQAGRAAKDAALLGMARRLGERRGEIVAANAADIAQAQAEGVSQNLLDRLRFGEAKIDSRIASLGAVAGLADPVGQVFRHEKLENGLDVSRVRVPLGVVLMIYEARPHVTVNAGAFCLKAGNAAILRGGSEARRCNGLLGALWRESLEAAGLPGDAVQVISGSHEEIDKLLELDEYIDLVIPRGGKGLIEAVCAKSRIPVIKHFEGICHVYLDEARDVEREVETGIRIVVDSKCLMPEVCNAAETLLVHEKLWCALPRIVGALQREGVGVRGCERTREAVPDVEAATQEDWATEYLDKVISVKVVGSLDEAIEHINRYGSHHTDAIVTQDVGHADAFAARVDSGVVLVNASTMYCDGASLGMGAEIGISTDKVHARGPMGLEELTSYKFVIRGKGNVMGSRFDVAGLE